MTNKFPFFPSNDTYLLIYRFKLSYLLNNVVVLSWQQQKGCMTTLLIKFDIQIVMDNLPCTQKQPHWYWHSFYSLSTDMCPKPLDSQFFPQAKLCLDKVHWLDSSPVQRVSKDSLSLSCPSRPPLAETPQFLRVKVRRVQIEARIQGKCTCCLAIKSYCVGFVLRHCGKNNGTSDRSVWFCRMLSCRSED